MASVKKQPERKKGYPEEMPPPEDKPEVNEPDAPSRNAPTPTRET